METKIIRIDESAMDNTLIEEAAKVLRDGKLAVIPTETVYGLAANALDETAVNSIFTAKNRPPDNPLIVHITDVSELKDICADIPPKAYELFSRFAPGPLTVVLKKSDAIPDIVSAGLDTVAVRIPSHKIARAIIAAAGVPIAAPSANISGKPSPTCLDHIREEMDGRVDLMVDGGECGVGLESTVVSLAGETPVLLRPGAVTLKQLESVLGRVELSKAVMSRFDEKEKVSSPGMKYRHYAPSAKLILVKGFADDAIAFIKAKAAFSAKDERRVGVLCFDSEEKHYPGAAFIATYGKRDDSKEQAKRLFGALRSFDSADVEIIYARCPEEDGIGLAVYNRLIKAAGYNIIVV